MENETLLNLDDYGEEVLTSEYFIDKQHGIISDFNIKRNNTETRYTKGDFVISGSFISDEEGSRYETDILHVDKETDRPMRISLNTKTICTMGVYKNFVNNIISKKKNEDIVLPAKKYTYESGINKTEHGFDVIITVGNTDVTLTFSKDDEVIVDGDSVVCIKDRSIRKLYIITDNILKTINHERVAENIVNSTIVDFENNVDFYFNSITSEPALINIVPELTFPEESIVYKDKLYKVDHDNFGVIKSIDGSEVIYEIASDDEDKSYYYSASLHKFINDNFDNGLVPLKNLYCLDVVESLDENFFRVMRRIYKIDKLEEFEKYISDNKDSKELVLDIITTGFFEDEETKEK